MAYAIHALVDAVRSPGIREPSDRAPREPEPHQLPSRNHSVLPFRQGGKLGVRTHFFPHTGNK